MASADRGPVVIAAALLMGLAVALLSAPRRRMLDASRVAFDLRPLVARLRGSGSAAQRHRFVVQTNEVIEFVCALSAELRSGQPSHAAFERLWSRFGFTSHQLRHQSNSHSKEIDIPAALAMAAESSDGYAGLSRVAACWQVAVRSGSGLAEGLACIAESLRYEREVAMEIEGQLAGPQATVRLLVVLPLFALVLGQSLGAHPIRVLLTSPQGWLCLVVGLMLAALGVRWVNRQVNTAFPSGK